jgi:hypothetical protein
MPALPVLEFCVVLLGLSKVAMAGMAVGLFVTFLQAKKLDAKTERTTFGQRVLSEGGLDSVAQPTTALFVRANLRLLCLTYTNKRGLLSSQWQRMPNASSKCAGIKLRERKSNTLLSTTCFNQMMSISPLYVFPDTNGCASASLTEMRLSGLVCKHLWRRSAKLLMR